MHARAIVLALLSITLVTSAIPAAGEPLVDLALGTPLSADFNADDGDWTANPPPAPYRPATISTWAWGAPTSGPGVAFSGSKVWATNLSGSYVARDCGAILSPPIDLSSASSASVSFMQWRHMEESTVTTGSAFDAGLLFVTANDGGTLSKVTPAGGYTSKNISTTARACLDDQVHPTKGLSGPAGTVAPGPTYSAVTTDLSAFVGQTVRFAIAFGADSSVQRAGWYIDDFTVTIDGTPSVQDFEAGDGGFTIVSTMKAVAPKGFSWGVPAVGGPNSTSPMWATNIDGNYDNGECAWVESPSFLLGDVADPGLGIIRATLTWSQWFRSNSVYTAGIVQVGVHTEEGVEYTQVTPAGGYNGKIDSTYVDQLTGCLGVPANTPSFEGLIDSVGGPMRAYQADISSFTGQEISIRYFFASAYSSLNPTLYPGWYIDDVNVDLAALVEGPDVDGLVDELVPEDGGADAPGWSSGGEQSTWAYGVASAGPVGELVYATNLSGVHEDPECSWIESPEIPAALLATDPSLVFEHYYDIYGASTAGAAWSGAAIFVSTNGGANWTYLNLPEYDLEARYTDTRACLHSIDPSLPTSGTIYNKVFSGNHTSWESVNVDLSSFAGAPTIKVRFVFSSGIAIYRDGYNVRSAEVGGVKIL